MYNTGKIEIARFRGIGSVCIPRFERGPEIHPAGICRPAGGFVYPKYAPTPMYFRDLATRPSAIRVTAKKGPSLRGENQRVRYSS